jgi:hypothetical protein
MDNQHGIIRRTHEKTFFVRMHLNSPLAHTVFSEKAVYKDKHVEVLQVLLLAGDYALVEMQFSNPL